MTFKTLARDAAGAPTDIRRPRTPEIASRSGVLPGPGTHSTKRLVLTPITPGAKMTFRRSRVAFANLVGATLPDQWPQFPQAFAPGFGLPVAPWTGYLFIRREDRVLIGNGGFVARPDNSGTVEIGYEVAPAYWNMGYATEAVRAMIALAFDNGACAVVGHALAEPNASNSVMNKAGMRFVDEIVRQDSGPVWQWRIDNY